MAPVCCYIKHAFHCVALMLTILFFIRFELFDPLVREPTPNTVKDPWQTYGILACISLYFCRFVILLCAPQSVFNFLGLVLYNAFPEKPKQVDFPVKLSLICFRVVTRGSFPELVRKNVERNINTCLDIGLENFMVEVVTDKSIHLPISTRTREVVVPANYRTKTGVLFKGRALQYALEDKVNILSDQDWVVHLDEETLLTESSVKGIINFALANKHPFGQGLITYGKEQVVNWLWTLSDAYRAADDMGKLRFQFSFFHKPFYGCKGSFIVAKMEAERKVSFDNGIDSSVAEDCFFSLMAYSKGYSFDFIEGEMREKSPFTIMDFLRQRKRWLQGILLTVHSPLIPFRYKPLIGLSVYSWIFMPLAVSSGLLSNIYPIPVSQSYNVLVRFIAAVNTYMGLYGASICFSFARLGVVKYTLCLVGCVLVTPVKVITETIAVTWGVFSKKHEFHVVNKNLKTQTLIATAA